MRLIDAGALIAEMHNTTLEDGEDRRIFYKVIERQPTIDPKRGKWIWLSSTYDRVPCEMRYMCSECHHETIMHSNAMSRPWEKFCPNCGARMEGEEDVQGMGD